MRLDADVIAWLKQGGPGYQTKANRLLRREMLKSRRPSAWEKRHPGGVARPHVMQDELEMMSFAHA